MSEVLSVSCLIESSYLYVRITLFYELMYICILINVFYKQKNLSGPGVIWQTVKTQMKCSRVFHQGLHNLLRQNRSSEKDSFVFVLFFFWGGGRRIKHVTPSKYTMDHPDLAVSNGMGNTNGKQRMNELILI